MSTKGCSLVAETLAPFLYPCLHHHPRAARIPRTFHRARPSPQRRSLSFQSTSTEIPQTPSSISHKPSAEHLNPLPSSYSATAFTDRCTVALHAGNGGHGCVSFVREKYIAEGPPNGGDGGSGGGIYIQAVRGETSLHKLARKGIVKAGRGKNGQGKAQGGERGDDAVFTVPIGTIVREVWRHDPLEEEMKQTRALRKEAHLNGEDPDEVTGQMARDRWILFPGSVKAYELEDSQFGRRLKPRQSALVASQPQAPLRMDLDTPMERPMLLLAGAVGGLGNPRFVSRTMPRPKYATKGEGGVKVMLELELKMLADVGLVGLPNAGKSTLLRALSNSRTRIGNWAFTTLQPSIGTVILDDHKGRPALRAFDKGGEPRTSFTIADIPGLIEDAHLNKGLGLDFLKHVERAAMLAFVIDLSAGDAIVALQALWKEVGEYETLRTKQVNAETENRIMQDRLEGGFYGDLPTTAPPISSKPWFVVGTKADLPETRDNFAKLKTYIDTLREGKLEHPSGRDNAWRKGVVAVPISAINAEGVQRIPLLVVDLLK